MSEHADGAFDLRVPGMAAVDANEVTKIADRGKHRAGCDAYSGLARLSSQSYCIHFGRPAAPERKSPTWDALRSDRAFPELRTPVTRSGH